VKLPVLFKLTSTGADQEWTISVEGNTIVTRYGQVGGKIQEVRDEIKAGKNVGRANSTTPEQQALAEAQSQWERKLKKGYTQNLAAARAGETDAVIEGGIFPMLAFPFEKQGHKIVYPCYGNPKLDGTRCIALIENGHATLWTRTRKPITSVPHIQAALERAFPTGSHARDGELYSHALNQDFEQIIHLVRQVTPTEGHESIQYWIYDVPGEGTFSERYSVLSGGFPDSEHLVLVEATPLSSESAAMEYFAQCQQQGFEGAILRNRLGLYVNKRSSDLIKLKTMQDAEFKIKGIEEGRGKLTGHVGAFVCETKSGAEFRAKLKGSTSILQAYFRNPSSCVGKRLTVRYQNLSADGIPRFPIGIVVRDYE
jgi:DNA ligase-1